MSALDTAAIRARIDANTYATDDVRALLSEVARLNLILTQTENDYRALIRERDDIHEQKRALTRIVVQQRDLTAALREVIADIDELTCNADILRSADVRGVIARTPAVQP